MTGRTPPPADPAAAEAIGEIRGQLREIIHNMNNHESRDQAIAALLGKLASVPEQLTEIKRRIEELETDRTRRDTERGVIFAVLRSPTMGWIAGAGATAWAYFTGRLHL